MFGSCLFLSGHLKVIAISPCQFRLVIRFFLVSPLFWSSKLIHLVDCRKVEEEGIIQHPQLHPDTLLSTTSLRESSIVGKCVRGCLSIVELMGTGCLAFMELILGVMYMYFACVRGNNKRSSDRTRHSTEVIK